MLSKYHASCCYSLPLLSRYLIVFWCCIRLYQLQTLSRLSSMVLWGFLPLSSIVLNIAQQRSQEWTLWNPCTYSFSQWDRFESITFIICPDVCFSSKLIMTSHETVLKTFLTFIATVATYMFLLFLANSDSFFKSLDCRSPLYSKITLWWRESFHHFPI